MSQILKDRKYTETHEWVMIEGNMAKIGVTDFAQHAMGDVVYVELPEVGASFAKGDDFCVVESVKGANDVYAPLSGKVANVNEGLDGAPENLNKDAYGSWIAEIECSDLSEADSLMDAAAYEKLVEELEKKEG
jgi:glycine cleavage system H protein